MNRLKMAEKIVLFCSPRFRKTLEIVRDSCIKYNGYCNVFDAWDTINKLDPTKASEKAVIRYKELLTSEINKLRSIVEYEFKLNPFRGQLLCDIINQSLNEGICTMHRIRIKKES